MTHQTEQLPPLIRALLTGPACYEHTAMQVQLIETHISWVLLTGEYAYKIKKPLNLGFLDFGTLAQRKQACAEEVRLNRRLAAEIRRLTALQGWSRAEQERLAPPRLWITHGLSGSGKTTLAQSLLQEQGMIRLRSDVERKRLAGLDALARSGSEMEQGLYVQHATRRTYEHLVRLSEGLLDAGGPVIVDAACLARWQRDLFRDLAQRRGATFRILDIQADHATLRERISLRNAQGKNASEADLRVLQQQIETARALDADELPVTTVYKDGCALNSDQ